MRAISIALLVGACGRIDFSEADCVLWLRMDEPQWVGAPHEIRDSCGHHDATIIAGQPMTIFDATRGQVGGFFGAECAQVDDDRSARGTRRPRIDRHSLQGERRAGRILPGLSRPFGSHSAFHLRCHSRSCSLCSRWM